MVLKSLVKNKLINTSTLFFDCFETIAERPLSFQSVDFIKKGYRRCPCGADSVYSRIVNEVVEVMAIIGRQDVKF